MKLIYTTFAFALLTCFCNSSASSQLKFPELVVKTVLKGAYNLPDQGILGRDSLYYFVVEVKLINTSNSSVEFLTYSCTSGGNVVVDTKYIKTCANNCGANSLTPIQLKPRQEFSLIVILKTKKEHAYDQIKIGWILIKTTVRPDDYHIVFERSRTRLENVIWSNPIELDAWSGRPFEIK